MTYKHLPAPFLISFLLFLAFFWFVSVGSANLEVGESALNTLGNAYEVNADNQGVLWISDNGAGEVQAFNPATNVYTTYQGMGLPSDARRWVDGKVWWVDQENNQLGQLVPSSNAVTRWKIPSNLPYGIALDASNSVWVTDYFQPNLYHFDLGASQLCTFTFGANGASDYVLANNGDIWLGDWINNRIHRLEIGTSLLTSWQLPYNARQVGLSLDNQANLWWADPDRGELARLEPGLNRLTGYDPPIGSSPEMIASNGSTIWYTDDSSQLLGRLDPLQASGSSRALTVGSRTLTPICTSTSPVSSGTVNYISGSAEWTTAIYTTAVDSGGWRVHQLPPDAYPWGVAASSGHIWMVDNGRQLLVKIDEKVRVTACSISDNDGHLNTTGDQAPLSGQTVYLYIDGVRQLPGLVTGNDGCQVWSDLEPNHSYGVEQEDTAAFTLLEEAFNDFGVLSAGAEAVHTFINAQSVIVNACSLSDTDGDLNTTDDRSPLPGQTVVLLQDATRQEPGSLTGADGCQTWSDLEPNHTYGLEQDTAPGWELLSPSSISFGLGLPGDSFQGNFIYKSASQRLYLPVVQR